MVRSGAALPREHERLRQRWWQRLCAPRVDGYSDRGEKVTSGGRQHAGAHLRQEGSRDRGRNETTRELRCAEGPRSQATATG